MLTAPRDVFTVRKRGRRRRVHTARSAGHRGGHVDLAALFTSDRPLTVFVNIRPLCTLCRPVQRCRTNRGLVDGAPEVRRSSDLRPRKAANGASR